ncbi:eukaryotic translation initiation factor 3 subunit D isoform 2 [Tropilaelaps mercedesae]|uniref:Eukaryotic translation initiation factor 3 subunit D n=1 Tax=Tropilaelaps mercedesae TaxID=418985 RepID=A0A1V9Y0N3_9ACAR|nr:eukaryotic translation initiation factor 3 subunit D isoform 2 [Tropilaelaps mercedesae]
MPIKFELPEIIDNPDGWGPSSIPEKFADMPYQPFSKVDRLGKVADWTGNTYQDRRSVNKYSSQFGGQGSQYAYYHDEDDSSFQLVDTSKAHKPLHQRGRFSKMNQRLNQRQRQQHKQQLQQMQVLSRAGKGRERERIQQVRKWQKQMRQKYENRQGNQNNQIKNREASVSVRPTWKVLEEMDFPRLGKLSLPGIEEPRDVYRCGTMEYFDKSFQNVNCKNERPLQRVNRVFHTVSTTDDPVIRSLAMKKSIEGMVENADVSKVRVYTTDTIISTLMCATRSVNSWDVVVHKIDDIVFLDKRNTEFDHIPVNETAAEPPHDEGNSINSPRNLALEATYINHNFSQQVLKSDDEKVSFENANPFTSESVSSGAKGELASVGYRYRQFDLGDGIGLVVRCEHDGVMTGPNGEIQYINIKALNEWDPRYSGGIDWRQKLDSQRGAVLANELKNNSCKLAKWTVQAILAGSQQIKFGYVSRVHVKDTSKHVILGTQQFRPKEFADQINLSMDNCWGVLRYVVDTCLKLDNGKYLFLKDPNKPVVRLYDIPNDSFESDEDDSSDEETNVTTNNQINEEPEADLTKK